MKHTSNEKYSKLIIYWQLNIGYETLGKLFCALHHKTLDDVFRVIYN